MIVPAKLPFTKAQRGPQPKYPFSTMRVGESFVVEKGAVNYRSFSAYVCARSRELRRKFLIARLPGGALQVYREK